MSENGGGMFAAIWRFFTFKWLRKILSVNRAADEIFTGSIDGIRDAFAIKRDAMVKDFQELRDVVSRVEMVQEQRRQELVNLNKQEADLLVRREGTLREREKAEKTGDQNGVNLAKAAFERYHRKIISIEERQKLLDSQLKENAEGMRKHMTRLTKLQDAIKNLPELEAQQMADFISNTEIIKLNDRANGIVTSYESGPVDAVMKMNAELSAKARISEKLAGTDVELQDQQYEEAGRISTAAEAMDQMLAARAAEREARTGKKTEKADKGEERPRI